MHNCGERGRAPPWEFNAPSVCRYIYITYVRHFWSRGPRATRKRKPAHLKFNGHMHACCIYVANASRAITTLIERLHMYSSSLITNSAGWKLRLHMRERSVYSSSLQHRLEAETTHEREKHLQQLSDNQQRKLVLTLAP